MNITKNVLAVVMLLALGMTCLLCSGCFIMGGG